MHVFVGLHFLCSMNIIGYTYCLIELTPFVAVGAAICQMRTVKSNCTGSTVEHVHALFQQAHTTSHALAATRGHPKDNLIFFHLRRLFAGICQCARHQLWESPTTATKWLIELAGDWTWSQCVVLPDSCVGHGMGGCVCKHTTRRHIPVIMST